MTSSSIMLAIISWTVLKYLFWKYSCSHFQLLVFFSLWTPFRRRSVWRESIGTHLTLLCVSLKIRIKNSLWNVPETLRRRYNCLCISFSIWYLNVKRQKWFWEFYVSESNLLFWIDESLLWGANYRLWIKWIKRNNEMKWTFQKCSKVSHLPPHNVYIRKSSVLLFLWCRM